MTQIKLQIETITPMFMSGADTKTFELRPASIKGLMRFWWRAAYWGENNGVITRENLAKKEGEIFGTVANGGNKSAFSVRIKPDGRNFDTKDDFPNHPIRVQSKGKTFNINILEYLAYGTQKDHNDLKKNIFRDYASPGKQIEILINIFKKFFEYEIVKSVYLLSVFGGLGAKSRNGFGQFVVKNPDVFRDTGFQYPFSLTKNDFLDKICQNGNLPNYTAFSHFTKILKMTDSYDTWHECLAEMGKVYRSARGRLEPKHQFDKRQYIGAPIGNNKKRRAKPYFMNVAPQNGKFIGYLLYLPAIYCDEMTSKKNDKFKNICDEFNRHLCADGKMEVIYER